MLQRSRKASKQRVQIGFVSLLLVAAVPSSMAGAVDAAADLRAIVLRSYAACDAGVAASDLDKCAAFRSDDYKQIDVEGRVWTSAQVDGGLSMGVGGYNSLRISTKVGNIRLLDTTTAIVQIVQTLLQVEDGNGIRNKLNSRWKVWDAAERVVERKQHATADQRWEKRDSVWRLIENRVLSSVIELHLLPAGPQKASP